MDDELEFSDVNFEDEDDNVETLKLMRRLSTLEEVR